MSCPPCTGNCNQGRTCTASRLDPMYPPARAMPTIRRRTRVLRHFTRPFAVVGVVLSITLVAFAIGYRL